MDNKNNFTNNYVHYQGADCITLMLNAFSEDKVNQYLELGKVYKVVFVGELGIPITVIGTFIGCLVEGTWGKFLSVVDCKTGYTWQIYSGNGHQEQGILSMEECTSEKL